MKNRRFLNYFMYLVIGILAIKCMLFSPFVIEISKDSLINSTHNSIRRIRDEPNGLSLRLKEIISEVKPYGLIERLLQDQFIQENKEFFNQIQMLADSDLSRRKRLRIADEIIEGYEIKDSEIKVYLKLAVSYQVAKEKDLINEEFIKNYSDLEELTKEIVKKVDSSVFQIFEEKLKDADILLKQRVALILLFAKDEGTGEDIRWQINGGFDIKAAEIMMKIARAGITEEKWYKIFESIEYFADTYYLNRIIRKLALAPDFESDRRKGALAEILNTEFLEKSGYKDYEAEVLAFELEAWKEKSGISNEINGIVIFKKGSEKQEIILEVMDFYQIEKLEDLDKKEGKEVMNVIKNKLRRLSLRLEQAPIFSFKGREKEIKNRKIIFIFSLSTPMVNEQIGERIIEEIKCRMKEFTKENLGDIIEDVIYGRIDRDLLRRIFERGLK